MAISKKFITILSVFLIFPFLCLFGETFSGEITDPKGVVQISTTAGQGWAVAVNGMGVLPGYYIKTSSLSSCSIELDDGSIIFVDENANASVEVLEISGEKSDSSFFLWFGRILANIEKSQNTKMQVKTPNSVASVRGTEFAVEASSAVTQVGVFEGSVEVQNPAVSTETVVLNPEEETAVENDMKPKMPEKLKEVMLRNKERMAGIREKMKALKDKLKRVPPEDRNKLRQKALENFNTVKQKRFSLKDKIKERNEMLMKKNRSLS